MENFTMVETGRGTVKQTPIAVRPFFDSSASNMGLEEYGMSLFDGVTHHEQIACLENNGVVRYLTGLNEFAPDIRLMNEQDKAARIKEIRSAVCELEKELAANVIDLDDPHFWNKVVLLKPDNSDFWNRISIACGNEPVLLDPKDPYDRIKLYGIEAGGFSLIAKSFDDATFQLELQRQPTRCTSITQKKKIKFTNKLNPKNRKGKY